MKALARLFARIVPDFITNETEKVQREWDRQRARAMSPSELSEIDAIFSRSV